MAAFLAPPALPVHRQLTGAADGTGTGDSDVGDAYKPGAWKGAVGSASAKVVGPFDIRIAGLTDPGIPGKQNQDDFFIWQSEDRQTVITGVFDGHGREMGQVAAKVAKQSVRENLTRVDTMAALRADPKGTLERVFRTAHLAIEESFKSLYEEQGWTVTRKEGGYLVRSKTRGGAEICVHGGTTATVVIVLDGRRLLVSNVGDSTAIIAGLGTAGELQSIDSWTALPPMGASGGAAASGSATGGAGATATASTSMSLSSTGTAGTAMSLSTAAGGSDATDEAPTTLPGLPTIIGTASGAPPTATTASSPAAPLSTAAVPPVPAAVGASFMELSADHSPESASEFSRMHGVRPHASLPLHPELMFVYDTLSSSKLSCPPIFSVDATGTIAKTERGSYYKNVRCEWATLVATPPTAPFQDALAFTRSLGDLHLQTWGVSHVPESWWMDLAAAPADGSGKHATVVSHPLALTVCSDGIWDNWKFEEVAQFILAGPRMAQVARTGSAQDAANDLMHANMERARVNFGSSADNMTAVVMYLFPTGM